MAERVRVAALGGELGVLRAGRRDAILRAGLLRSRQRVLSRVGRDRARSRDVHAVRRTAHHEHRRLRRLQTRVRGNIGGKGAGMNYSTNDIMTVTASRRLLNGVVCFVGIGLPSTAANLARLTHAKDASLIYEAGPIGAK